MNKICCIDFDGTICEWAYPNMGEPTKGVKEALEKMKEMDYEIHILSCRTNIEVHKYPIDRQEQVREMERYLHKHKIPFDRVLNENKPVADWYIDDRAIGFRGNWEDVIKEIK